MEMAKPSEADLERFRTLVPELPETTVKPMFGNLGAFVNGNMFMGLFGPEIGLKLDQDHLEALLAEAGSGPFGPADRPMGGYAVLPSHWDDETAHKWIIRAHQHIAALPPKKKKQPKKKTKSR